MATINKLHSKAPGYSYNLAGLLLLATLAGCQSNVKLPLASDPFNSPPAPRAAAGDTYVYRLLDGYGNKPPAQVVYRVEKVDGDRTVVTVTPSVARDGVARTEIYASDGNWLQVPLNNHDLPVVYQYSPAYPAYQFPLAPDKMWSTRVSAANPETGKRSVRVDGKVVGAERIRVPAGEFDTIKVRRIVYAGDADHRSETTVLEFDWYAPILGRAVRTARQAEWREARRSCDKPHGCDPTVRGEWYVYELESFPAAGRQLLLQ